MLMISVEGDSEDSDGFINCGRCSHRGKIFHRIKFHLSREMYMSSKYQSTIDLKASIILVISQIKFQLADNKISYGRLLIVSLVIYHTDAIMHGRFRNANAEFKVGVTNVGTGHRFSII